jgi:Fe-S oxidoreductase
MAEDYKTQIHRCFNCGFCKFDGPYTEFNCPSYVRFRFDTFSTSGRLWLINAWLKGEITWDERLGEILYTCVTCKNCTEHCIMRFAGDIVDWIIAARTDMMEKEKGRIPERVATFLEETYRVGNPLKARGARDEWATGVPRYTTGTEYLLYVGCLGSFEEHGQQMARSLVRLLERAGVSFGILGNEETCCGNEVHALGEQTLFEYLATQNIERFNAHGVQNIVALSPHAYNALKNLYPKLGGKYRVLHYSQLLNRLIREGRLTAAKSEARLAFHDPCYLGRYNGIYEDPRQVLEAALATGLTKLPRERANSFCCGGGSGNFAMDSLAGSVDTPGRVRVREARAAGADVLAVACPSCLTMLDSAAKSEGLDEQLQIVDIAQLLEDALVR